MKIRLRRLLLALSLMVTGLAVLLTILHSTMVGFCCGNCTKDPEQFLWLIRNAGLTKWMVLSAAAYAVGLFLLLTCDRPPRKDQDREDPEK